MSDETAASPEKLPNPPAEGEPRARRISNPRPKKRAKGAPASEATVSTPPADSPKSPKAPKFPEFPEASDESAPRGDWPEPEAASAGTSSSPENPKRKRRRKKGKSAGSQNPAQPSEVEPTPQLPAEPSESAPPQAQRQHQPPRTKLDPELLAKSAWKIYLSEVSEEGVALVGDNDAKELARRCFRLAEIFLEEQARRR